MSGQIRVLIIDENPTVREALMARLSAVPELEVVATAWSFEQGLEALRAWRPDVVLLELKGRSRYGLDPIGTIFRAMSGLPVGVIVLTSYQDDLERAIALQAGAQRYLLKDIDSDLLIGEIAAVAEAVQQQPEV
jgi:DNA-binding NarL/FixJ family response regulator